MPIKVQDGYLRMPVEDFPEDPPGTAVYYATPRVRVPDVAGMDYKKAEREMRKAGSQRYSRPAIAPPPAST